MDFIKSYIKHLIEIVNIFVNHKKGILKEDNI